MCYSCFPILQYQHQSESLLFARGSREMLIISFPLRNCHRYRWCLWQWAFGKLILTLNVDFCLLTEITSFFLLNHLCGKLDLFCSAKQFLWFALERRWTSIQITSWSGQLSGLELFIKMLLKCKLYRCQGNPVNGY